MKRKQTKLNFKPTPISRLSKMVVPFKMVGDPDWNYHASGKEAWEDRQRAVYAYEMERRELDVRGFTLETYQAAWSQNIRISRLLAYKWSDYDVAIEDNILLDREQAERDDAAWEYHRDNFLVEVL